MTPGQRQWCHRLAVAVIVSLVLLVCCYRTPTQRALNRIAELGGTVQHDTWVSTVYPYINLDDTDAFDEDLKHVIQLDGCCSLSLKNTHVTDRGADSIRNLSLAYVDLRGTKVSRKAVFELCNSLRHFNPEVLSDYSVRTILR